MNGSKPKKIFPTLGPKFVTPRPIQEQIAFDVVQNLHRLNLIEAPTGIGKSPLALCISEMLNSPLTVICTATLSLQEQYERDFPNITKLIGRSNFPCTRSPGLTAAEAPCTLDSSISCQSDYYEQERRFLDARHVITNYPMYLSDLLYGRRWRERRPHLLVCDEGHRLLDFLTQAESVELDMNLADTLGLQTQVLTTMDEAKDWTEQNLDYVSSRAASLTMIGNKNARAWVRLLHQLRDVDAAQEDLIITKIGEKFGASPLWPRDSARELEASANIILLMSATLYGGGFLSDLLGFGKNFFFVSPPSPFESWRWPVYYRPVLPMTNKSTPAEWKVMGTACHNIMHTYVQEKGVIHVASNLQAEWIARQIRSCHTCRLRLVSIRVGERRAKTIDRFREQRGTWIIHPSIGEGESFDDEQCRVQVIAKIRYPDLGNTLVRLRAESGRLGKKYYFHSTAAYTAQTIGRGMRHASDYSETYILDKSFETLYDRNRSAFPNWFHAQLQ